MQRTCERQGCGEVFRVKPSAKRRFCSVACGRMKPAIERACECGCGAVLRIVPHDEVRKRFASKACLLRAVKTGYRKPPEDRRFDARPLEAVWR